MANEAFLPQNYSVLGQAPLDAKLVFKDKQQFFDLKSENPRYAFNFYKGMLVYFEKEEQMFVWELEFSKFYDQNDRIDNFPFKYPPGSVYNDLDYSDKIFQLIEIPYNKENIGSWDPDGNEREVIVYVQNPVIGDTFTKEQILEQWPTAVKVAFIYGEITGIKLFGTQIQLNQEISLNDWEQMTYEIWNSTPNFVQTAKMLVVLDGEDIDYTIYAGKILGNSFKEMRIIHDNYEARFKNSCYFIPGNGRDNGFDIWVTDHNNILRKLSEYSGFIGSPGPPGQAATINVGTVESLPSNSLPVIVNVGTENNALLNFGIPKGDIGPPGQDGTNANPFNVKGNVATYANLPTTGNISNDAYFNIQDSLIYIYNGTSFPPNGQGIALNPKPSIILTWSSSEIGLLQGASRLRNGNLYIVKSGQTSTSTPPEIDTNTWELVSKDLEITQTVLIDVIKYKVFTLYTGNIDVPGNVNASVNWIHARIQGSDLAGMTLTIKGFGNNASIVNGSLPRVIFYNATNPIAANKISLINHNNTIEQTFVAPANTQMIGINIDGFVNVGLNPSTSPYNNTFKIYQVVQENQRLLNVSKIKATDRIETNQLHTIENKILNIETNNSNFFDGLGFPQYELGKDGDKYLDKSSKRIFIKSKGYWEPQSLYRELPFTIPSEFTFIPSYPIRQMDNGKYFLQWKGLFVEKVKHDYDSLTKYYVDNINGLNTNNGLTPETAVKTIAYARNTLEARNIILAPGTYWFNEHFSSFTDYDIIPSTVGTTDVINNKPLIVRCINGMATFIHGQKASLYTWTLNSGCYTALRDNVVDVMDLTNKDKNGVYLNLIKVNSIAECQSTPNSWFTNGINTYIRTIDNRIPDNNISLNFESTNSYISGKYVPYVYFENIISYVVSGGQGFIFRNNITTQYNAKVYLKNIYAFGNSRGNGIAVDNIKETIVEGCGSSNVLRDALNYHTSLLASGYTPMKVIEIDCYGYNAGVNSTEISSNGSTSHEGISIIRLNGNFENTMGSVIADVSNGALSLNLGITAINTLIDLDSSFRINGVNSKMWIYYGTAYSNLTGAKSIGADTNSIAYYDENTFFPNGNRGNVIAL